MATITSSIPTFEDDVQTITEIGAQFDAQRKALQDATALLRRRVRDISPGSTAFVGFIREYRYTAGKAGEMPTHRMYVECDKGVWLYANVPSSRFERIMQDENGEGEITAEKMNGRMVLCVPDSEMNAIVPIEFVERCKFGDRNGRRLYVGAPVLYMGADYPVRGRVVEKDLNSDGFIKLVSDDDPEEPFVVVPDSVVRAF